MFNVVDIGFNSIFLKASKDLLEIAKLYNLNFKDLNKKIFKTESSLLKMYNKKKNIFYSYDLKNKFFINIPSISNYFILFADLNDKKVNKKIIESLKKYNQKEKYIFSSIKPDHKSFEEKRYWRGPVWINTNWIIYQSLKNKDKVYAKKIKDKTIKLIEEKNFFEYYSCKNAETLGANNFSWSSALYLDLIYESN
jgi:glycogen debranching enzyme